MRRKITNLVRKLVEYLELKLEKIKLGIFQKISAILAVVILIVILMMTGFLFVFFLSLSFSQLLNSIWESTYIGYLATAGFYLILMLVFGYLFSKGKINIWLNKWILKILNKEK